MSGSNCCDSERVFLFPRRPDGSFAPRQEVRFELPDIDPAYRLLKRGLSRPHLVDWNRDGHTDLVVGYPGSWKLYVSAGPLTGKAKVAVKPFALPVIPDASPLHFGFTDWDGDGRLDLLLAVQRQEQKNGPWVQGIYWFRNTSASGEPTFASGSRLLTIPAPWELMAFAAVDGGRKGHPDLVVSVSKRRPGSTAWDPPESQVRLYRWKVG